MTPSSILYFANLLIITYLQELEMEEGSEFRSASAGPRRKTQTMLMEEGSEFRSGLSLRSLSMLLIPPTKPQPLKIITATKRCVSIYCNVFELSRGCGAKESNFADSGVALVILTIIDFCRRQKRRKKIISPDMDRKTGLCCENRAFRVIIRVFHTKSLRKFPGS